MDEYRVSLEVYNGPLDLLLYLIRREELDIYDIPVSRITEQYLQYVELIQGLDPNLAGDFLLLAATLLEIKTRMLLPVQTSEDSPEAADDLDPRSELVRQLLQYKAFKDASHDLGQLADTHALRYPRRPAMPDLDDEGVQLEDVQVWDLFDAFSRLLAEIGKEPARHEVIYDETPVELHAVDLLDRLHRDGPMRFSRAFEGCRGRGDLVGLFLALLELVRQKRILTRQDQNFGDILIELHPEGSSDFDAEDFDTYRAPLREARQDEPGADGDPDEAAPPEEPAEPAGDEEFEQGTGLEELAEGLEDLDELEELDGFEDDLEDDLEADLDDDLDEDLDEEFDDGGLDDLADGSAAYAEALGGGMQGQYVAEPRQAKAVDHPGDPDDDDPSEARGPGS